MNSASGKPDFNLDTSQLFREESISDGRAGTIRCLHPVKADGSADDSRAVVFQGQTQVMTPMGVLPVHFEIDASNLADAVQKFGAAADKGLEDTLNELREMQRQQASSIVVPGAGGGMGGGLGGIQLR
jgi:hypothetical protein